MLFLVQGKVTFSPYMSRWKTIDVTRLVEADRAYEARAKFEKHYSDMSIPNDDSYFAEVTDVSDVIL